MEVSVTDYQDDVITTITQSIGGINSQVTPKDYFMTSKGLLRLQEKGDDPQWKKTERARSQDDWWSTKGEDDPQGAVIVSDVHQAR